MRAIAVLREIRQIRSLVETISGLTGKYPQDFALKISLKQMQLKLEALNREYIQLSGGKEK